jgi:hypothetical protein
MTMVGGAGEMQLPPFAFPQPGSENRHECGGEQRQSSANQQRQHRADLRHRLGGQLQRYRTGRCSTACTNARTTPRPQSPSKCGSTTQAPHNAKAPSALVNQVELLGVPPCERRMSRRPAGPCEAHEPRLLPWVCPNGPNVGWVPGTCACGKKVASGSAATQRTRRRASRLPQAAAHRRGVARAKGG